MYNISKLFEPNGYLVGFYLPFVELHLFKVTLLLDGALINIKRSMRYQKAFIVELTFWILALALLATANPSAHHFTLCPLANLGFDWCPGCGLGRSITAIFNGDLKSSFQQHWFGILALLIIIYRIYQLGKKLTNHSNTNNYLKHKEA